MDFVDRFQHEILTGEQQIEYLRKIKLGDDEALNELIRCNQRYVASICYRYATVSTQDVEFDDLMQAGNIGLLKAIELWDEKRSVQFSTYAFYWIRAKARRFALHKSTDLSISFHYSEKMVSVRKAKARLLTMLHREPTMEEIADYMKLPVEDVKGLFRVMRRSVRLDEPIGGKEQDFEETRAVYLLSDASQDTEEDAIKKALIARATRCVSNLSDRQQIVMSHLYGLNGCQILTTGEIARKLGVSHQAVDQLRNNALKHLRIQMTSFDRASTF